MPLTHGFLLSLFTITFVACSPAPRATAPAPTPAASVERPHVATADRGEVALLGGRLVMRLPQGARVLPQRQRDIMSAPEPDASETRVALEPGQDNARFLLMVREIYATSTDLRADAAALVNGREATYVISKGTVGAGLDAVLITPDDRQSSPHQIQVEGALLRMPDGTLVEAAFFILPEIRAEAPARRRDARALLTSLRATGAKLPMVNDARVELMDRKELVVRLPAPAVRVERGGEDFTVTRFENVVGLGRNSWGFSVYVGQHPSYQHDQTEGAPPSVTHSRGQLLGRAAEWHAWDAGADGHVEEAIAPVASGTVAHVMLRGTQAEVHALRAAAETATISP